MPLLERESALETLGGWFAEARAGVGKTTLVNEFALRPHRRERAPRPTDGADQPDGGAGRLGRLRAHRGDPGVWPPLDEALTLATMTGELQRLGPVAIARAEAAWLKGDPAAARGAVEGTLDLAERVPGQTWPWPTGELAFWLWRLGGPDRLPTRGLAGGAAEPVALQIAGAWEAAADRWRARGCPYEAAAALATATRNRGSARR